MRPCVCQSSAGSLSVVWLVRGRSFALHVFHVSKSDT